MSARHIVIAGGTGFIGRYLVPHFVNKGDVITVIGRSSEKIKRVFNNQVRAVEWQQLKQQGFELFTQTDLIINLTGATIGAKRWSKKRKQEIIKSRTQSSAQLSQWCADCGDQAPMLFNTSAVGVYGSQPESQTGLPPAYDENTPIDYSHPTDFLSTVGSLWEQATQVAQNAGVRVVLMRFGVVLGKKGGALSPIKLPFYFYIGGRIGSGKQPFSWVCMVDLCNAIEFLYDHREISGPVNIVAPGCVSQANFAKALGRALHKPSFLPTPGIALQLVLGEMATELLLHGQHVIPQRLTQRGFEFQYPDIDSALAYALNT